jgi:hypothetical protein
LQFGVAQTYKRISDFAATAEKLESENKNSPDFSGAKGYQLPF